MGASLLALAKSIYCSSIAAIVYTIIISKTEINFTLLLPYPFKRKFQAHVFMEFAVYLFR